MIKKTLFVLLLLLSLCASQQATAQQNITFEDIVNQFVNSDEVDTYYGVGDRLEVSAQVLVINNQVQNSVWLTVKFYDSNDNYLGGGSDDETLGPNEVGTLNLTQEWVMTSAVYGQMVRCVVKYGTGDVPGQNVVGTQTLWFSYD